MACAKHMTAALTGEDGPWCWGRCGSERVEAEEKVTVEEGPWCWGRIVSERMAAEEAVTGDEGPLKCAIKHKEAVTGKERLFAVCKAKEAEAFLEQGKGEASEYLDSILTFLEKVKEQKSDDSIISFLEQEVERFLLEQHKEEPQGVVLDQHKVEDQAQGVVLEQDKDEVQARMELYKEIHREYNPGSELDAESLALFAAQDAWIKEELAKSEIRRLKYAELDTESDE